MSWAVDKFVDFATSYTKEHAGCSKEELARVVAAKFELTKQRSVYRGRDFAVRFSYASGQSFANVVLSLAALSKYDALPMIVCVVRPSGVELLLANSTFLRKISHSSHELRVDNVRGSFLGHDISRDYEGLANVPDNFEELFIIHQTFDWTDNLVRLVEATSGISPSLKTFTPTTTEVDTILAAAELAARLTDEEEYIRLGAELDQLCQNNADAILAAASIDNVNLRGNAIEHVLTGAAQVNGLDDFTRTLAIGPRIAVDIKTKLLALTSSPKAYNVDKFLRTLAGGNTVFDFFFVGIDVRGRRITTCLVAALDETILIHTRVQFHWAGRGSRGVTQLTGDLSQIFSPEFKEHVDIARAKRFLQSLLQR